MIDKEIFIQEMSLLSERFNRELSKPVFARYYAVLSSAMSTAEFITACNRIFNYSTFYPSPAEFLKSARGSIEDRAQLEWMELVDAQMQGKTFAGLSDAGKRAYRALGGAWAFKSTDISYLKRDFIAAFQAAEWELRSDALTPRELSDADAKALLGAVEARAH